MKNWLITFRDEWAICDICHDNKRLGVMKLRYVKRDYESENSKGYICKKLQQHPRELWVCVDCLNELKAEIADKQDRMNEWIKKQEELKNEQV